MNPRVSRIYPANSVVVREVGLRDGIQMAEVYPDTGQKKQWIEQEYNAGVHHFEVGSFLPATRFPQFADIRELVAFVHSLDGAFAIALVLNERGITDALEAGVDELTVVISATEEHNQANARRGREDSIKAIAHAVALRDQINPAAVIHVGISMAFGCSIAGAVDPSEVIALVQRCLAIGADTVGVADTVGYAGPRQVSTLCGQMTALMGDTPYAVHLHDTRGMGIANAAAAITAGARIMDASLGGLGGCPFAPGATGNIVIEDLVFLIEKMGYDSGIELTRLANVRSLLKAAMPDEPLYGGIAKAGLPKDFVYVRERY